MSDPLSNPGVALSPAQLKAALWADERLRVYALVLGAHIGDLPTRLEQVPGLDYHCLVPGALGPEEQARAPYLVALRADDAFADWLLFEATLAHGEWGLVVRSAQRMLDLRSHARDLRLALAPDGQRLTLDWMDPEVLRVLLPPATPEQLQYLFGPLDSLLVAGAGRWDFYRLELGALQHRACDLLKAA
jgi:hypothetical protein